MILKVVIRNLIKRPFLNLIKVTGLSLALTGILFIALFLKNELSFDKFNEKADRIYRYTIADPDFLGGNEFARIVNPGYIPQVKQQVPEIEDFVRLRPVREGLIKYNEQYYNVDQAFECDSTFFQVFDAELTVGNKLTVLENPASMVISETLAERVFGKSNPVGEMLSIPSGQFYGDDQKFTVSGVMKDFPFKSHFHPVFIATPVSDKFINDWAWTYLLLSENANPENVVKGVTGFIAETRPDKTRELKLEVHLQKLSDIHLHSNKLREIEPNGNIRNIYVLAIAAFILLLISISNFANLNLGMAGFTSKYLLINKILGSSKTTVAVYFFAEGLFIILATLLLTLFFAVPVNSLITRFFGMNLLQGNFLFMGLLIFGFTILSLVFGMVPVLRSVFANFKFRSSESSALIVKNGGISRGLIVFQYAFSIALIIAVIVISCQTDFAYKNGMGVQENNIVCLPAVHANIQQKFGILKTELLKYNSIKTVSAMMEPPGGEANDMFSFEMEGFDAQNEQDKRIGVFPCDYSFATIFNLKFLGGTNFSEENTDADNSGEYIINEAAMHRLNYSNANEIIGKEFKLNFPQGDEVVKIPRGKIIGVVKDFYLSSLKKRVEPLVLFKRENLWLINFVIASEPGMQKIAISDMKNVWNELFPEYPFQYEQVGAMYQKVYRSELLQARLLSVFTLIALFICSMGLFGLALIITQQRTKEIGVRKVNGAKIFEILILLNKDFVKWVGFAFVLACPAGWFAMHKWLENFAYKIPLNWWIFAGAGIAVLGIALLSVSFQSWKAASKNPVEALRYE